MNSNSQCKWIMNNGISLADRIVDFLVILKLPLIYKPRYLSTYLGCAKIIGIMSQLCISGYLEQY